MGELDVAKQDNLLELVGEEGVVDVFPLFHQQVAALFHQPGTLGFNVDDHNKTPPSAENFFLPAGRSLTRT